MNPIRTEEILLYLMNCTANQRKPECLPADIDFDRLWELSRFHSVTAMVSYALNAGGYLSESYMTREQKNAWASARIGAMRKRIMFDQERATILRHFEENQVWYMPLKGCILQDMYPDLGVREMADNDILFDPAYRKSLHTYMKARDYDVKIYNKSVHDVYTKKPCFNFEFHVDLVDEDTHSTAGPYYRNVKERLLKDPDNEYGYHFSDEDFYIYMMVHALKHFHESGTGIRILSDIYVFLQAKEENLNWSYIDEEMEKLGEEHLERRLRDLSMKLFDREKQITDMGIDDVEELELLSYLFGSGTYGTVFNRIQKDLVNMQEDSEDFTPWLKFRFLMRRLIPDAKHMGKYAPFCKRHKWAIPFFWIYRIVRGVLMRGKSIMSELRALIRVRS